MGYGYASYGTGTYGAPMAGADLDYDPAPASDYGTDHMNATNLDVANAALTKLGADTIASLSENSNRARTMNQRIEWCKWAVLRLHPWNFAQRRVTLSLKAITGAANNGVGKIRITCAAHGYSTGQTVRIISVGGTTEANGLWVIGVISSTQFDLNDSAFVNTYTSGGKVGKAPAHGWDWSHDLPADFIRFGRIGDPGFEYEWAIENVQIMTDEQPINILYIANVTNYGLMDVLFRECLATHLAIDTCIRITQSNQLLEQLTAYFKTVLPKSRFVDASEDSMQRIQATEFLTSRFGPPTGGRTGWAS